MIHTLRIGDKVKIWPRPGHVVAAGPPAAVESPTGVQVMPSRILSESGEEVVWSYWLHERAKDGSVYFSDPQGGKAVRHAEHVHPAELAPVEAKHAELASVAPTASDKETV